MEPSNVRKLSPEDRDKLVLQLEREEADLTERDYDRYQDLIKQDLGGLTTKKVVQSLLALFDTLTDGLIFVSGLAFFKDHADGALGAKARPVCLEPDLALLSLPGRDECLQPLALPPGYVEITGLSGCHGPGPGRNCPASCRPDPSG